MRLDYSGSTFVIVGNWNPHILNEAWIRKNLLDSPLEPVNMAFKGGGDIAGSGFHVSNIAAMFRNVALAVSSDRLELNLIHSNDFGDIEDCVQRLCHCQPNTLVSAYGVNLTYIRDGISKELINSFTADPLSEMSFTQNHRYAIHLDGITTNIAIELNKIENKSAIAFNFHFKIDDLSELIPRIDEFPIVTLNEKAVQWVSEQYGLRLES